jgi:hypothetical protein
LENGTVLGLDINPGLLTVAQKASAPLARPSSGGEAMAKGRGSRRH